MPDGVNAKTTKSRKRRAATKSEQVELLCRLWRAVLTKRDDLADESAAGKDAHALAARAQLSRLDAALAEYLGAQRGQLRLKRIADRWCGDQRVEALRVTEDLLGVILGEATGGTLRRKWARLTKRLKERGREVVFRQLGEREVLSAYADEVREVLRVLGVSRRRLYEALVRPDVETALYTLGARTAALTLLKALGFGSVSTSYRKLAAYAFEHNDGVVQVRGVPRALRSRPKRTRRSPPKPSRKTGHS